MSEEFEPGILLLTILVTSLVMTFGLVKEGKKPRTKVIMDEEEPQEEQPTAPLPEAPQIEEEEKNQENDAP
jgi:hypothetical protein